MEQNNQYQNPLIEQRADPWVYKHSDGFYYFTASVPEYDRIELRKSKTIQGLNETDSIIIWEKYENGPMSANIWAPEIHYINHKWYVYFAAAKSSETKDGLFDHRMFVLENESEDPMQGNWVEKGQIKTKWETFALDATHFEHLGVHYLVWPQKDPSIEGNSNLYISELENPWTLKGEQVMIATPEYEWEKIGFYVNEGPAVIKRNGKIFITFSASATNHHYCMGLLTADENSSLLDPSSWVKHPEPIFTTNEENQQFGPGHNSFTVSENGKEDVLIYHARNYKKIVGDPLYDPNRHTRAQVFSWDKEGRPFFGAPLPDNK
ncbi:alpha-N-arabinofuranosidase [Alkalihalobacillus alcalophilus ATCC 27647 = CGMCC 1.3604]|uniref:Alpha-N-arabinofuranosidase n=1 Tax=Alkalihalobacillus alcalophilus ATCC 27647 = CGMCC 1.3604 TaxID=1218173 RepID=A0A094XI79_ALKAL|nr:family 43 glycosylhydrolase [Alkalihalobacillus alcalophilus]KGA98495.1 alpha-N-arabinofuranosidase [Alkalihalobacillus alcalophilus ATCC 27647 = CGMCC 1.3604]MED1563737.1 family 43 glycosylhydrolase [Alkalihalobacillus alcalophilus]THG91043.1 alpha-N-arabinofuranosidase [Alkalihalobacillus alcalophilus ATCC 27647 = CGMCC 1.3604]